MLGGGPSRLSAGGFSLLHADDYGVTPESEHQPFALRPEMHDDAAVVLEPEIAAAHRTDDNTALPWA